MAVIVSRKAATDIGLSGEALGAQKLQ